MEIKSAKFIKSIRGTNDILYETKRQIAFIGRSNVGKSSLMNCLLNKKDLVKSGKLPGKTANINFFLVNDSYYFVDLPGYGYAKKSPEAREQLLRMIHWYLAEQVFERKIVLVLDIKVGLSAMDIDMLEILREQNQDVLVIANKSDLLSQNERTAQINSISASLGAKIIACSAKTKAGRLEILEEILSPTVHQ